MERRTMTVKEIAAYLGLHADTIYTMTREREIPHIRMRGKILFSKETIDVWMLKQPHSNRKKIL